MMHQAKIESIVRSFVESLNGRYDKFMPREDLVVNLSEMMWGCFDKSKVDTLGEAYLGCLSYQVGSNMFEGILECTHKAAGNSHHVAQRFSEAFAAAYNESHLAN